MAVTQLCDIFGTYTQVRDYQVLSPELLLKLRYCPLHLTVSR